MINYLLSFCGVHHPSQHLNHDSPMSFISSNSAPSSYSRQSYQSTLLNSTLPSAVPSTYDLHTPCMATMDGLWVCHINANSLRAHIESIRHFLLAHPTIHLIAISETWLGPCVEDCLVSLDDYVFLRHDRNTHGGGGGGIVCP